MTNPYLYAKQIFNQSPKERKTLESDKRFFQAFLSFFEKQVVKDFLVSCGSVVSQEKKIELCIQCFAKAEISLTKTQRHLLSQWVSSPDLHKLTLTYHHWLELVEDFFLEGEIRIYATTPVSENSEKRIKNIFLKKYPNRTFICSYHKSDREGIEASFRDTIMNLQPQNWLKNFIFSLRKGL